jgi:hypothetical protein
MSVIDSVGHAGSDIDEKNDVNNPARFTGLFRFAYMDSFGHENA